MVHGLLADLVLALHAGFILFVVLGGLLVLRWPRMAWVHVPAVFWGVMVEMTGWICPLTPLEVAFRRAAGGAGYDTTFLERYLVHLIYPATLTREVQVALGVLVLTINLAVYGVVLRRTRRRRS
jgi:hypothetical protein